MRRLFASVVIGLSLCVLVGARVGAPRAAGRTLQPADDSAEASKPKVVGVTSCAAIACHNGGGARGSKGSEYSTWIAVDPHGRTFRALFKEESERMHKNLARYDATYKKYTSASENPLCLKCHGMGPDAPASVQADGVGCERCHGPASEWRTTHYVGNFDRHTPGFIDLRSLETRAGTCMKCHVGDADQEVNHDLIAAGHPRLRFEFAAYYASYPRHWRDTDKTDDPGFEARSWVVGQLMTARAALELLASRTKGNDPLTHEPKPWPEFAEYECVACHHGLTKPSERQKRDFDLAKEGKKVDAGALPWGTWYYALLPVLAKQDPGAGAEKILALRDQLNQNMRKRLPPRKPVADEATEAANLLGAWLDKVKDRPIEAKKTRTLFEVLTRQQGLVESGWDGGTQVFLGLAAMHNALTDENPALRTDAALLRPLEKMRKELRESFDKDARLLYDSPLKYNYRPLLKDLKDLQGRLK